MKSTHTIATKLAFGLVLAMAAGAVQALDCEKAANKAQELYAAKAAKNEAAYESAKKFMQSASDEANIYPMLIRAVDEGLYSSPDAMHKAALKYCSRKLAAK